MSNKCIARSLRITPETVKTHVKAILSKLNARTRAQAVAQADASAWQGDTDIFGILLRAARTQTTNRY